MILFLGQIMQVIKLWDVSNKH